MLIQHRQPVDGPVVQLAGKVSEMVGLLQSAVLPEVRIDSIRFSSHKRRKTAVEYSPEVVVARHTKVPASLYILASVDKKKDQSEFEAQRASKKKGRTDGGQIGSKVRSRFFEKMVRHLSGDLRIHSVTLLID